MGNMNRPAAVALAALLHLVLVDEKVSNERATFFEVVSNENERLPCNGKNT